MSSFLIHLVECFAFGGLGDVLEGTIVPWMYYIYINIIMLIVHIAVKPRHRFSLDTLFFFLVEVSCPFLISWWTVGYVHPTSVIIVFLSCIYTVIAIPLSQCFIDNPIEFKQGKLYSFY